MPTVTRNVPFVVITFTSFAALKERRLRQRGADGPATLTTLESLAVGVPPPADPDPNPNPHPDRNRNRNRNRNPNPNPNPDQVGVASAIIAGMCTQPIDVVKTRMMTQAPIPHLTPHP